MLPLPIDPHLPRLIHTLRAHPAAILIATPGAGKTTRVPPALLAANFPGHILMLQPRRVAARASAQRIADENHWQLGREVGYHIRFEKRYAANTPIRILTEAILTRILLDDPYLDGIGTVILDEFHERSIHADLALALLREIQQTVRPDLKLLIMSATLDAAPLASFLGNVPVLTVEGHTHPLTIAHRPPPDSTRLIIPDSHLLAIIEESLAHPDAGDLLIFLPGRGEIERATRTLQHVDASIVALHGSLSPEEQQRALRPDPARRRKIILATNIAETSLTIDGVRTVIDTGLARIASFDPDRGMDRLDLARISNASATQRAGRAARQAPGRAFRLWSQQQQNHLPAFNTPDIHRIDLTPTLLALHAWTSTPDTFHWFDPPAADRLQPAEQLLHLLGALHDNTRTPLGRHMQKLPLHPRLAKLLLAAHNTSLQNDALCLATLLSDDTRPAAPINPLTMLDRLPLHLTRARDQLALIAKSLPTTEHTETTTTPPQNKKPSSSDSVPSVVNPARSTTDLLLLAYPDRLARRRDTDPLAAVMVGRIGLRLAPDALTPALAATPFFLALDPHHDPRNKKSEATVRTAIPIEESALTHLFPNELHTETLLVYSEEKQKVLALTRRSFNDLILSEDPHGQVDPAAAGPILAAALAPIARQLFEQQEQASRLLARIALLRHHLPEHPWPLLDDAHLAALLTDTAAGKRTRAQLTNALPDALRTALPYPLDRLLDQLAPESLEVPSGSKIKIDYPLPAFQNSDFRIQNSPPTPILAVRLQELFGLLDTPRIANNRVPLLLHLLSPGYKPIQITQDLKSFWSNAYFEVRKDLRTRYPKHKWPDDPLTAAPEAKGRPHR